MIKGAFAGVGNDNNIPATAAITAVRPAPGDKLFPPKADTATAASTGNDRDSGGINKFHWKLFKNLGSGSRSLIRNGIKGRMPTRTAVPPWRDEHFEEACNTVSLRQGLEIASGHKR